MLGGCDLGPRQDERPQGPRLHVIATEPPQGAGLDCARDSPECGVPTDVTLVFRFDRFLLPDTAIRQSISFFTGAAGNLAPPPSNVRAEMTARYDVLERTVRFALPPGVTLQPNALYTAELPIYGPGQPWGFRAFDGAPLEGTVPPRLSFRTGSGPSGSVPSSPALDCAGFLASLARGGCGAGGCHGAPLGRTQPAMGLRLDSAAGLLATAVRRPAHETETGDTTGVSSEDAPRFGANMPLIDPGRPDNSYLLYKLLIAPEVYQSSGTCPDGELCDAPAPAELDRLRAWFVLGEPMPFGTSADHVLRHEDLRDMQAFITAGADCQPPGASE